MLQVSAAMGLASYPLAMSWQTRFAIDVWPGFDMSALLVFDLPKGAAAGRMFDTALDEEADPVPIVLNGIAARQLGFATPERALGQTLLFKKIEDEVPVFITKRIVGIAPEVRFNSLREAPGPIVYVVSRGEDVTLTVRASKAIQDAERAAREVWSQYYPNSVLDMKPAKALYAANYGDDARLARMLSFATIVAMVIAAFGVYVLAADIVQRRTREIALRKLFGSQRRDIGRLVAQDIGTVMLVSAVIALPLTALAIGRYLAAYTERSPFAFWALGLALLATLATAALAGARHAWLAMTLKPAVALRS